MKLVRIILFLPLMLFGQGVPIPSSDGLIAQNSTGSGGTTYTQRDSQTGSGGNDQPVSELNTQIYVATKFTSGGTAYDVTKVTLSLRKQGTPNYTMQVQIFSDTAGVPNASLGNGTKISGTVSSTTLTGTYANYDFLFTSGNEGHVNSSVALWVVIKSSSSPNDAANFVEWQGQALSATANQASVAGTVWTSSSTFAQASFTLFSSP